MYSAAKEINAQRQIHFIWTEEYMFILKYVEAMEIQFYIIIWYRWTQ